MKYLMIAALATLSATAHTSTVEAAGWRSCKATSVNCTSARTKAVRVQNQRRAASATVTSTPCPPANGSTAGCWITDQNAGEEARRQATPSRLS